MVFITVHDKWADRQLMKKIFDLSSLTYTFKQFYRKLLKLICVLKLFLLMFFSFEWSTFVSIFVFTSVNFFIEIMEAKADKLIACDEIQLIIKHLVKWLHKRKVNFFFFLILNLRVCFHWANWIVAYSWERCRGQVLQSTAISHKKL